MISSHKISFLAPCGIHLHPDLPHTTSLLHGFKHINPSMNKTWYYGTLMHISTPKSRGLTWRGLPNLIKINKDIIITETASIPWTNHTMVDFSTILSIVFRKRVAHLSIGTCRKVWISFTAWPKNLYGPKTFKAQLQANKKNIPCSWALPLLQGLIVCFVYERGETVLLTGPFVLLAFGAPP